MIPLQRSIVRHDWRYCHPATLMALEEVPFGLV